MVQRRNRLAVDLATRWRSEVNITHRPFYPREAVWAPEPVSVPPLGFGPQTVQPANKEKWSKTNEKERNKRRLKYSVLIHSANTRHRTYGCITWFI